MKAWTFFDFCGFFLSLQGALGRAFLRRKKSIKTCSSNVFGNVFGHVLKVQSLSSFPMFFQVVTLRGAMAFFSQNRIPQSKFRTCLDTIRNSFGHFENIENFQFFFQFFLLSNFQGALSKILSKNMISKHVQNMFDCFSQRFLGILKIWKVFLFFEVLPSFDPPGCTGQFFQESHLKTSSTTCLDTFRNVFGHFWNFKFFYISSRIFTSFDIQGALVIRNLEKNHLKTNLDTFGNVFGILKIWIFLHFFDVFRLLDPPGCTEEKNFEKITAKQNWTLLESVLDIFEGLKFFRFSRIFLSLQGAMGRAFLRRKKSIKTRSNSVFVNVFGQVLKVQSLSSFSKFFQVSTLRGALVFFFEKITPKQVQNMFEHF